MQQPLAVSLLFGDDFRDPVEVKLVVDCSAFSRSWLLERCSIDQPFEVGDELWADEKSFTLSLVFWVDLGDLLLEDSVDVATRRGSKAGHLRYAAED